MALCLMPAISLADISFQANIKPVLSIPKVDDPIKIDGKLDDPAWQTAAVAGNFSEHQPGDNTRPPVNTIALVTYDDNNFYMAFIAYDDPKTIRASLRDRDDAWQDDDVGIILDTYADGSWAYEIFVNPIGVQGDLRWSNNNEDMSFDIVYQAAGAITDSGYQVEIAVPFKSLRFPDKPIQTWHATFWRNRPRGSREQYSWAAIDKNNPCFPCSFGTLTGIENVKPGRDFEFLPSITGFQSASLRNPDSSDSGLKYGKIDGRLSLGIRYPLSSSASIEATYKPDFSQVESDVTQIDVNSTFALFYPEHRPFFQEGADLFDTPFSAVYSRSINDPEVAAKVVGRMNRFSFAYLGARDQSSPIILPFEERDTVFVAGKSTSNIVRIKRTILDDSFVGALFTTRSLDADGLGSLCGLDGRIRFLKNYSLKYQMLLSHTKEPNDTMLTAGFSQRVFDFGRHTTTFDGESFWGNAGFVGFGRDAKYWGFNLSYSEKNATFRADNGFETGNDRRQAELWNGVSFYPNNKIVDNFTPNFDIARVWNSAGTRKDEWFVPEFDAQLKGQTHITTSYVWSNERFHDIDFGRIHRWEISITSNFSDPVIASIDISHGRFIARNLDIPVLGRGTNITASTTLKPCSQFSIQPTYGYAKLNYPDGSKIFEGYILRTKFSYQFTLNMFLRLVLQYDHFDRDFQVEPLLSYKLNPFTIFYVGSTQAFDKFDGETGMTETNRQFFLKFQYLIRR